MSERPRAGEGALAIVTGASSGLGVEFARLVAADGYRPVLVARRRPRLEKLADELRAAYGVEPIVEPLDLAADDAPPRLIELAVAAGPLEVLINNAGFGTIGPFATVPVERTAALVRVNVAAPTRLAREALDGMRARGRGYILNVASTAAFFSGPRMAAYYASKAYLLHLSEALWSELRDDGVRVTVLCPGPTRTEFQERAGMSGTTWLESLARMDAAAVARAGYRGLGRGRRVVVPGLLNRLTAVLPRLVPRALAVRALSALHAPRSR